MQALHFGAGNIGKGFIGYLLNKTGYEVCFVDVNQQMIDNINQNNGYSIELLDDQQTVESISPASALNSITQEEKVIEAIVRADIITTSVGVNNLARIANVITKGLLKRANENKKNINVIANENAINASSTLKQEIEKHVSNSEMNEILSFVGFPNTAIDRLALSKESEEGEIALVEPVYEWIINQSEMVNDDLPLLKDAILVQDLTPYIERKLYIVNMGHAATAYIGHLAGKATIQSTLLNPELEHFVKGTIVEASRYIMEKFNISTEEMDLFIEKTLNRFKNKNISDDVLRVGRSPIRKLSYNERLVKPTRELFNSGRSIEYLCKAIATGFLFNNPEDEEAVHLQNYIQEKGIDDAILHFSGIESIQLKNKIKFYYEQLLEFPEKWVTKSI